MIHSHSNGDSVSKDAETFPRILYKVRRRSNNKEGQPADKCNLDGVCKMSSAPSHKSAGSRT